MVSCPPNLYLSPVDAFHDIGESLFQTILGDPLLELGRPGEPSFQLLHAVYLLECSLEEYSNCHANFEIVFWHSKYLLYNSFNVKSLWTIHLNLQMDGTVLYRRAPIPSKSLHVLSPEQHFFNT